MRKGRRKLNQTGMSLIELVVVILILGILSAGTAVGVAYANNVNAKTAAEKLNSTLERTRLLTISSDADIEMELFKDSNGYCGQILRKYTDAHGTVHTEQLDLVHFGNDALTITVQKQTDPPVTVSGSNRFVFAYKKENGAFEDSCLYSVVTITGSKTKKVQLVHDTGRSFIK